MPKPTFSQISQEKRDGFVRAAAKLFAERGFSGSDMSELAKRAGVSKGSIYNYFESKEDLYVYVCQDNLRRSRLALYGDMDPEWTVFEHVEHIFQRGVDYILRHPENLAMYLEVASPGMERFADQMSREVEKYTADHLKAVIRRGIQRGNVRADVDPSQAAFIINGMYIIFISSLATRHFQIRMQEYLEIEEDVTRQVIDEKLAGMLAHIELMLRP